MKASEPLVLSPVEKATGWRLFIKTILARLDRVPTLVFDEVDAGIGGLERFGHEFASHRRLP